MVFNDSVTKLGLLQDCEMNIFGNYGDVTGSSDRLYDFTARINRAYDKLATKIMSVDNRWQWDDTNYTDFPTGSTSLVSGQQDYTMDVEFLDVVKVLVLDSAGNRTVLTPFDITDPIARSYLEDSRTTGGIPHWYDKTGCSLMLYPIPNYNSSGGLIVYYRRKASYFTYTDTTKTVGVPALFHRYLSLEASLDYAVTKQLSQKNDLAFRLKEFTDMMEDFYAKRSKDESKFITPIIRSSR